MGDKCEVFLATLLDFQRLLGCKRLYCATDRRVQDAVHDVKRQSLQVELVDIRQVMDASTKNIVFCNHLLNFEPVFKTLQPVYGRRPVVRAWDRRVPVAA